MSSNWIAVILAAGDGTRMNSGVSKLLHPVAGMAVIDHVLAAVEEAGISRDRLVLVLGHGREEILRHLGDGYRWVLQDKLLGTADAVMRTREACSQLGFDGRMLVACGDAPLVRAETIRELMEATQKSHSACTVFTGLLDDPRGYGRVVRSADGEGVEAIVEQADADARQQAIREVNSGLYAFACPDLFERLGKVRNHNRQQEYYLPDVVREIIASGGRVTAHAAGDADEILGINDREDLALAQRAFMARNARYHMARGVTVTDPATTYIDCGVEIGRDSVVHPCTVVEAGVKVGSGCHIGPFARLSTGTVLGDGVEIGNFVEVKRSRIAGGSKAKHLAYLGDAQVGNRVNIGAGTIVANYDGSRKHPTQIADGAFIGSGSVLVAPVRVGRGAMTAAGAVVTRNHDVDDNTVVAGVPARLLKKLDPKPE